MLHSTTVRPWASTTGLDILLQESLFCHCSGKRSHVSQNTPEALSVWPELQAAAAPFLKEHSQLCRGVGRAVDSTAGQCSVPGLPQPEAQQIISPVPANSQPQILSLSCFCEEFCSAWISQRWDRHPFPP